MPYFLIFIISNVRIYLYYTNSMSTDIQQTQIENISPSLENKGNFLSQIKSNPEFIQEQKDKIISFYNSLSASDKEKFELEIIENQELLSVEFENIFAGISKKY